VVLAHYNEDLTWVSKLPEGVRIRVYSKGAQFPSDVHSMPTAVVQQLPNVGRESHTYLKHIVDNYDNLAYWTVFTQAGAPSFGYKGHRSGGGHLLAGDDFANYLVPDASGSRFVYTAVVHLPSMNHLLRAAYCINDELLEGGSPTCPKEASQWTPWWDIGDFRKFVSSMVKDQHGDEVIDFYRKYINPSFRGEEIMAFFPQGARFAVSRETIQRRPKRDYEQLLTSLSTSEDPYAGYFMEWLWSELFLGHQEPCPVPSKVLPVSHTEAMNYLAQRFPLSVERQLRSARALSSTSGSGCVCKDDISSGTSSSVSSSISGGFSGSISGSISSGISGGISGSISGGISGDIPGGISGGISGTNCICGGESGGASGGTSGDISGGVSEGESDSSFTSTATKTTAAVPQLSSSSTTTGFLASAGSSTTTTTTTTLGSSNVGNMSNVTNMTNVTHINDATDKVRVAGTLQVQIDVRGNLSQEVVQDMFRRAIAAAVNVSIKLVVRLEVSEINASPEVNSSELNSSEANSSLVEINSSGLRRLQSVQAKWYEVAYEVEVPSDMDADTVVSRANRIAVIDSAESLLFREVLMATAGVEQVGKIVSTIPASKVGETTAAPNSQPSEEDDRSWKAVIIGAVAVLLGLTCLVVSAIFIKRKMSPNVGSKHGGAGSFATL
jgi:hypothetical protein